MPRILPLLLVLASGPALAQPAPAPPAGAPITLAALSDGVAFVENRGQWPDEVRFLARTGGADIWVTDDALLLDFYHAEREALAPAAPEYEEPGQARLEVVRRRGHVVAMRFEGGRTRSAVGHRRQATYHSYFLGADSARWASYVPLYAEVVLEGLYDGVDLRLYEDEGHLRYDLVLAPGADLAQVRVRMEGADGVAVTREGALRVETALGPVEHRGLLAYQESTDGRREVVASAFVVGTDAAVAFAAEGADPGRRLVLDPLLWSTFLGRAGFEYADAVAVGDDGSATVVGRTTSANFPTTPGAYDTTYNGGDFDAFVTRLSADGASLLYSTFLGGSRVDHAFAVAVGVDGSATVAGDTESADFPATLFAFDPTHNGGTDAFVTRLSADGASLLYSTFLGGTADDGATALAAGADGTVTVAGRTYGAGFPVTPGAYDPTHNGDSDAFVARLAPDGDALVYATFLGGSLYDAAHTVVVEADGHATVAGGTSSAGFPVTPGAFDPTHNGVTDAFVARLAPDGDALVFSTYLGGSLYDAAFGAAVGPDGTVTVAGRTFSRDFPTTPGAFDNTFNEGTWDAFVARFTPDGDALVFSTYLGGHLGDSAIGVVVGADGSAIAAGQTKSTPFPTTPGAFDTTDNTAQEVFVTRFTPDGSDLLYSTYLGAQDHEYAHAIALGPDGSVTIVGETQSVDFPTTPGAYDRSYNGDYDAFVARLKPEPTLDLSAVALNSPVTRGDVFRFQVTLTNMTAELLTGDLLLQVRRQGPFFFRQQLLRDVTLAPGQTATPTFAITVPQRAPLGRYTARLMVYAADGAAFSTTDFEFRIVAAGGAVAAGEDDAALADAFNVIRMLDDDGLSAPAPAADAAPTVAAAVWPNPAAAATAVTFALAAPAAVRLAVYDVLGREVLAVDAGRLAVGPHRLGLDVSALPAGVYVWRLAAGERVEAGRLTVAR